MKYNKTNNKENLTKKMMKGFGIINTANGYRSMQEKKKKR